MMRFSRFATSSEKKGLAVLSKVDLKIDWATHEAAKYACETGTIQGVSQKANWPKLVCGKMASLLA